MRQRASGGLVDEALRAALTMLLVALAAYFTWQFLRPLLGPLVMLAGLLVVLRMAAGWRSRGGW